MTGLIGKTLKHSFSKDIHYLLGNKDYQLIETDDVMEVLSHKESRGFNVTIPYKQTVIPYLSKLEGVAKSLGVVNTIVNENNSWVGYNTDYQGFEYLLNYNNVSVKNKKVLLIGNGASSKTVALVCKSLGASSVKKLCRHIVEENEFLFEDVDFVKDAEIIINTTPVGMYPNNQDRLPLDLEGFSFLTTVIDIIYNPLKTNLLLSAETKGYKAISGLAMLVAQAAYSHELFFQKKVSNEQIMQICRNIYKRMYNIVLIGLPLSGKSKFAKLLSETENKLIIDTDSQIESIHQSKISDIFASLGESVFRGYESEYIDLIYKSNNQVISTGGGMVLNHQDMMKLKQNGWFIFLDKHPDRIAHLTIHHRPLLKNANDVYNLYEQRLPLYKKYADATIHITKDTQTHLKEIEEKLNEYLNSQWT